jgi:hypothetical protein
MGGDMTIMIELTPKLQLELARQAATHGVKLDVYAAGLLEDAAHRPVAPDKPRHLGLLVRSARRSSGLRALEKPMDSRLLA